MKKKKKRQARVEAVQKIEVVEEGYLECFRLLMMQLGTTYPKRIFDRRINLLTKKEMKKYDEKVVKLLDNIFQKFGDEIDDIDEIMSIRAEKENDPWK